MWVRCTQQEQKQPPVNTANHSLACTYVANCISGKSRQLVHQVQFVAMHLQSARVSQASILCNTTVSIYCTVTTVHTTVQNDIIVQHRQQYSGSSCAHQKCLILYQYSLSPLVPRNDLSSATTQCAGNTETISTYPPQSISSTIPAFPVAVYQRPCSTLTLLWTAQLDREFHKL